MPGYTPPERERYTKTSGYIVWPKLGSILLHRCAALVQSPMSNTVMLLPAGERHFFIASIETDNTIWLASGRRCYIVLHETPVRRAQEPRTRPSSSRPAPFIPRILYSGSSWNDLYSSHALRLTSSFISGMTLVSTNNLVEKLWLLSSR